LPNEEIGRALAALLASVGVYRVGMGADADILGLQWAASAATDPARSRKGAARCSHDLLFPRSTFDAELAEFLVRWQEGDELRSFSSPSDAWQAMMGSGGVALVRDGRPIACLLVWMN